MHSQPYTKEQLLDIAVKVCPKLKEETSRIIGEEVWRQGNKDIRDVISLSKLLRKGDGLEEIKLHTNIIFTNLTDYFIEFILASTGDKNIGTFID